MLLLSLDCSWNWETFTLSWFCPRAETPDRKGVFTPPRLKVVSAAGYFWQQNHTSQLVFRGFPNTRLFQAHR